MKRGWKLRCRDCGTMTEGLPVQYFEVGKYFCNVTCYRAWRKNNS